MIRECQRCGSTTIDTMSPTVKLFSNVMAYLCANCVTAFNEWLSAHPIWQEVMESDAIAASHTSRSLAKEPPGEQEFLAHRRKAEDIYNRIRPEVKEFVRRMDSEEEI